MVPFRADICRLLIPAHKHDQLVETLINHEQEIDWPASVCLASHSLLYRSSCQNDMYSLVRRPHKAVHWIIMGILVLVPQEAAAASMH